VFSVGTPITKAPPHLVVTDDGRRPWHERCLVPELADGRKIICWWGNKQSDPYTNLWRRFLNLSLRVKDLGVRGQDLFWRLYEIGKYLGGGNFYPALSRSMPHSGSCNAGAFVGVAFLPDPPKCWLPDAVWPGWRHLAHGRKNCEKIWEQLEKAAPEELLDLLEAEA